MKSLFLVSCLLIPFYLGYELASMTYENDISNMQIQATKERNNLLNRIAEQEKQYQEKVSQIEYNYKENMAIIDNKYNSLNYEFERLLITREQANTTDTEQVSNNPTTTTGTSNTNSCQWIGQNGLNYKELLAFAKERDEVALRYNALLKLYNEMQLSINESNKTNESDTK